MRYVLLVGLVLSVACTKPNPDFCCTDGADCAQVNETEPRPCADGLSCQEHSCVAELCESAAECNASAPFCTSDTGLCGATCDADTQCPGFGGSPGMPYCVTGECVECRGNDDCATTAPICADHACRSCAADSECSSGACDDGGECVDEANVAYVSPGGSDGAPCTRGSPCSLVHALDAAVQREVVVLASGTYSSADVLVVTGRRRLLGDVTAKPVVTRSTQGPIITIGLASTLTVENLVLTGAKGLSQETSRGTGIVCGDFGTTGSRTLTVINSDFHHNASDGVQGSGCSFRARNSTFEHNQANGVQFGDSTVDIDRCTFIRNQANGANLDGGEQHVSNSISAHNTRDGVSIYASVGNSTFDFNTIADNVTGFSGSPTATSTLTARNNLVVRNTSNFSCQNCTVAGNVAVGTDISGVKFQSPDSEPYDYHLLAGSTAIDAAVETTAGVDHDFDGEARPTGSAADVGADEYVP